MANRVVEILVSIKDDAVGFFSRLGEAISSVTANVFSLSTAIEAFVTGAVLKGIEHLVDVFAQTDMTITRVNAALQISGRYTREGSFEIQKMAVAMQDLTVVSREAALEVSATVGALARELSASDLAQVQKAAIGLSETFGISLERASSLIGRTLEGSFNALHRYGIEVDLSASQQDRFTQVMSKMAPLFEISKEAANTFAGAMEQAKNQFIEIERTLGEIIANAFGLGTPKSIRDAFKNLNTEIREHAGEWVHYARIVIDALGVVASVILTVFKELVEYFSKDHFSWLRSVIGALGEAVDLMDKIMPAAGAPGGAPPLPGDTSAEKKTGLLGWINSLLENIGTLDQSLDKLNREIEGKAPKVHLAQPGHVDKHVENVGHQEEDPNAELLHETAVAKDLTERLKLLQQAYVEGRGNTADYAAEHEHVANALERSAARLRALIDGEAANFITKEKARAQLVLVQADLEKLASESLLRATLATHELTAAERANAEQLKTGQITYQQYIVERERINASIQAEIDQIKKLIEVYNDNPKAITALTKLLGELNIAMGKNRAEAKTWGETLKEANDKVRASTIDLRTEMLNLALDATASAATMIAAHQNIVKAIGVAIQQEAKKKEEKNIADALEALAIGFFDLAMGDGKGAGQMFMSAAEHTAAAAAYALIAGGGGGSSGGASGGGGAAGANATSQAVANLANGVTIIVPPGLTNSQQWVEELMGHIEAAGENRITVRSSA